MGKEAAQNATAPAATVILGGNISSYFTEQDLDMLRQNVLERSTFQDDVSYIIHGKCRHDAVSIGAALPFIKEFLRDFALRTS